MAAAAPGPGSRPERSRRGGRSPYKEAVRRARTDTAVLLLRYGARDDATDVDRFLDACVRADRAEAGRLLRGHPGLRGRLTDEDRGAVVEAADHGDTQAVRLMLDLGFPLDARGGDAGTTPTRTSSPPSGR